MIFTPTWSFYSYSYYPMIWKIRHGCPWPLAGSDCIIDNYTMYQRQTHGWSLLSHEPWNPQSEFTHWPLPCHWPSVPPHPTLGLDWFCCGCGLVFLSPSLTNPYCVYSILILRFWYVTSEETSQARSIIIIQIIIRKKICFIKFVGTFP